MSTGIEKLLRSCDSVHDYQINSTKTESYELFFVHRKLETVRSTDTESVNVTVYVDHDGKRGNASFRVYASTTEEEMREKIALAVEKAKMIDNQPYKLPEEERADGEIASNLADGSPAELAERIASAVFSADQLEQGSINALEIFINRLTVSVKNSRGIDKREVKYNAMIEAIPTWNDGESVELYEAKRFSGLDPEAIRLEIEEKMREVRDRGKAQPPKEKLSCPVLLKSQEMRELVNELVDGLNYATVYAHANRFSVGDAVQTQPEGDRLEITMRGKLEGSVSSALFDRDGSALTDTAVITNGTVSSYYGGSRYAQYLDLPVTGNLPCVELQSGTLTAEELAAKPYFVCASMSGLQLDLFNDYIGGEVRLGYYFDGKELHPVTGVSISGKLSEALNSIRLADTVETEGNYRGPVYGLLEGVEIV